VEIQNIVHMQYSKGLTPFHMSYCSCFGLLVAIGVGRVYQWNDDIESDIGLGIKEPTCLV
jgi:hypothetical protein